VRGFELANVEAQRLWAFTFPDVARSWMSCGLSIDPAKMPTDCAVCFGNSRFRAGFRVTLHRKRPGVHEGGELGYSLAHAHGAAFDNPDLGSPPAAVSWNVSDEPIDAPLVALADALKDAGISTERFRTLRPREVWPL
jgi:hypothetical protein